MRRFTPKAHVTVVTVGLLVLGTTAMLACSAGCGLALLQLVQEAEEIPVELAVVLDDAATFQVDPNEALAPIEGGTVVSDVTELDGCWRGGWWVPTRFPNPSMDICQVLKFDAASGQLERFIHQSLAIVVPIVMVQRGTFTLDADGTGTFEVTQALSTIRTGQLIDDTDHYGTLPVYEVQLAWDGDELLANFSEVDTPRTSGGFADSVSLWYQQFDCP
jgi:hypothetical protein